MQSTVAEVVTSIAQYSKTEAALADFSSRYKDARYDVLTRDGMAAAIKARAELRSCRVALEKTRIEIKAPALRHTQAIDSEARRITAALVALEDPIDAQIKSEETRKENERLVVERAEQARLDAEQQAIKDAEQRRMDAERAEIANRQAKLDADEKARLVVEAEARRKIEDEQRAARERIEADERAARMAREEADRSARLSREAEEAKAKAERDAEEARLKSERDKIEAERRTVEEAQRKAREAEEANQREIQRQANELLDARAMLTTFVQRFGHLKKFAKIVKAIKDEEDV